MFSSPVITSRPLVSRVIGLMRAYVHPQFSRHVAVKNKNIRFYLLRPELFFETPE